MLYFIMNIYYVIYIYVLWNLYIYIYRNGDILDILLKKNIKK